MSAPAIFMGRFTASSDGGWFMGLQGTSPSAPIIRVAWVGTDNTRTNFDFTANTNTINVFDTNNFHNVGLTFTNGILTEYWDGVPFTTNTGVLPCHVNANSFCVGGDASPNGYTFAAQYADVRIYEHALSQSEINNIIARFPSNRAADVVSLMTTAGGTFSGAVTNSYGFVGNGGGLTNYQGTNLANGGSSVGQILTATTSGVTWSNAPSVGGSATNAINNNGGSGTNLTVYGTLTSTNMLVSMTNVATSVGGGVSLSTVTNVAIAISDTNGAAQAATNNFMVTATNIAQSIANGVSGPTNGITATTATNIANSFYIQSTNAANLVGVLPQYPTVQVATNAPFTNAILASPDGTNRVWVSSIPLQAITNSGQSLVSVSTNCLTWTGNSWIFGKPDGTGQSTNTTIALLSGSTARAGRLLLHNTGTPSGAVISNVGTLTFGETYASPPMVMIAPGWATNAGTYLTALQPYDVTTTNVLIRYSPSSATPAANDSAVYEYWIVP
jgi:hypothetical protein